MVRGSTDRYPCRAPTAFVSCHVESPLDDAVWDRFVELFEAGPGGFEIVALMRPPAGKELGRQDAWVARARHVAREGLLGHHTHFGGGGTARPPDSSLAVDRVRREHRWLTDHGLRPRFFCGGGWFMNAAVAALIAEAGYVDCTGLSFRPAYLNPGMPHLAAMEPCVLILTDRQRLVELPVTHSIGMVGRSVLPARARRDWVHLYFHDWDLMSRHRALALRAALIGLGRRYRPFESRALPAASAEHWVELPASSALR
jgi:hypothetical protein